MRTKTTHRSRRGSVMVQVTVSCTLLLGMVALAVDIGLVNTAHTELQSSADSAALAAASRMLDNDRLKGVDERNAVFAAARGEAVVFAAKNLVLGKVMDLDRNDGNAAGGDIMLGYLNPVGDRAVGMSFAAPSKFNAAAVRLHADQTRNGPVALAFASIFGVFSSNLEARAAAAFEDGVVGFRIDTPNQTSGLLPFALHRDSWFALMNASPNCSNDNYTYDPATKTVSCGGDGIPELNLYPGSGTNQLPPGNFGTVDIGSTDNSTLDISRQIDCGVNQADLSYFGGELKLGPDGTLILSGDTGISAGFKDNLEGIKSNPRIIPLFSTVAGGGDNSQFTVVGFAGVRVMNVKLTGSMGSKGIIVQPAIVTDSTAISDAVTGTSYNVYRPVTLCR